MSVDPVVANAGDPQAFNAYSYARNNPVSFTDPTGMCFDERGRLFVCELHGYNLDGHLDVVELNRAGVLDREVRRIPADARAQALAARETYGTVKLLVDDDGDGRMDRARVWADRLPPCYGLILTFEFDNNY